MTVEGATEALSLLLAAGVEQVHNVEVKLRDDAVQKRSDIVHWIFSMQKYILDTVLVAISERCKGLYLMKYERISSN